MQYFDYAYLCTKAFRKVVCTTNDALKQFLLNSIDKKENHSKHVQPFEYFEIKVKFESFCNEYEQGRYLRGQGREEGGKEGGDCVGEEEREIERNRERRKKK